MLLKIIKVFIHVLIIVFLTITTQIGGVVYLVTVVVFSKKKRKIKIIAFIGAYCCISLFVIPFVAPVFGREKIKNSKHIQPNSFIYVLTNRNYVVPQLNTILTKVSTELDKKYPGIKLVYLDANFPFFDGFPLLPHLSHNDGKKIDLSLIYEENKALTNKKKSISGYGVFSGPTKREHNQITVCKQRGKWQYDFPKYLTFGSINKNIRLSAKGTKFLVDEVLQQKEVSKLFIEPHLKTRLGLQNRKVRYHGCQAVRHDDHIHFQLY